MSRLLLAEVLAKTDLGNELLPHINPRRGAQARDVENTLAVVELNFNLFRQNVTALLQNLNENLTIGARINIDSFLGTLADLQSDLTHDLMGVGDQIDG